ncbi:ABC transporter ATP-binding protein [Halobacteriovorax marinus]|uniref:ABC-F family ATP-binding cassette domain-containing protein n=1 Tax=Halobacteriovorax marinus TaxID=97084 RepID=UPI000BC2D8FC|nr:ABC-F family ATP-binding cassette domain-containing protein [Halobacteriovorax marinus]ATH06787.1 ABC transporter ATP-binding protein [Halobacteriovorax marinus]
MIQLNNISKSFGGQNLYEDISFTLGPKERIGLVGRNGSGKSTLFKIITGEMSYDGGSINIPKSYKIGYLRQHLEFSRPTVLEECIESLSEEEKFDHYKAEKILSGLGFSEEDMQKEPASFSGGYQIRINLTKCLLEAPNLLLLDEPTNYLDIISLRWLKNFLKNYQGEVILITHDRDFMDDVVTHTMGLSRGGLKKIKGDTVKFYERLLEEEQLYEQTRANQEKKKKELMAFVDRFRAKASKATQAQSRLKQLQKMGTMDELSKEGNLGFSFRYTECPGKTVLNADNLSFSYDGTDESLLFKKLKLDIKREDCIGIIGKNGKGKSTLLNVLTGELSKNSGEIKYHPSAQVGHFGQTNINRLSDTNSIVAEITSSNSDLGISEVRSICGSMMFEGELADKKISVLSGGEKSRVMLGKILAHKSNILFLDEPTNHLDMESVETLCEKLEQFPGAIVLVTHNEMFLRRLANRLVVFREGGAEVFEGSYDEFLEKVGWEEESASEDVSEKVEKISRKDLKRLRADLISERSKETKDLKKRMDELESDIFAKEEKIDEINDQMLEASSSGDNKKISELSRNLGVLQKLLDIEYEELSTITDKHEEIIQSFEDRLNELEN